MNAELYNILYLLGSLAFLLFGLKMMSEGVQKVLGDNLGKMLSSTTENRFAGVFKGIFTTALVQSSSATIVVTVSLVNAGILTLLQSGSIILGANIGTTITSWLVATIGFNTEMYYAALPLIAMGVPLVFAKKKKVKFVGEIIIGFAILFWGFSILKDCVTSFHTLKIFEAGDVTFLSTISFVLIGAVFSFLLQSSAAAVVFTQIACYVGVLPIETGFAMVLGHNIGSTINAEISAYAGNVHAKRAARIHSIFNLISSVWMILLLSIITPQIDFIAETIFGQESIYTTVGAPMGIAIFHTSYNVINVLIMIGLLPYLVKLATQSVKSKGNADEEYHLEFMDSGLLTSPEISITEAKKELVKFAELTKLMNATFRNLLKEQESNNFEDLIVEMRKREDITDNMQEEITNFLSKVSQGELTEENSVCIRRIIGMVGDLEQVGDIYYANALIMERKKENKVWFIQEQRDCLNQMLDKLDKAFDILIQNLKSDYNDVTLGDAKKIEEEIDALRDKAQEQHLDSMENGAYSFKSGLFYKDLYANFERVGDYLMKVNEVIAERD